MWLSAEDYPLLLGRCLILYFISVFCRFIWWCEAGSQLGSPLGYPNFHWLKMQVSPGFFCLKREAQALPITFIKGSGFGRGAGIIKMFFTCFLLRI